MRGFARQGAFVPQPATLRHVKRGGGRKCLEAAPEGAAHPCYLGSYVLGRPDTSSLGYSGEGVNTSWAGTSDESDSLGERRPGSVPYLDVDKSVNGLNALIIRRDSPLAS